MALIENYCQWYLLVGCRYRPQNVVQLLACAQAARLDGMHLNNLYKCQQHLDETLCEQVVTEDGRACTWVSYSSAPFDPGVCLPAKIGSPAFLGEFLEVGGTHVRSSVFKGFLFSPLLIFWLPF